MGFLDLLSSSSKGEVPGYLRKNYEKFGLDPDKEMKDQYPNKGKNMYCTQCRKIYNGGYKCGKCNNILVEWH